MATITKDLGPVTAYKYAVSKGYTGTEEEFAELMANLATAIELFSDVQDDMEQLEGTVNSAVSTVDTIDDRVDTIDDRVTALEEGAGDTGVEWENIVNPNDFTPSTNCGSLTGFIARKTGKILYLGFSVTPSSNLSSSSYVEVKYKGPRMLSVLWSFQQISSLYLIDNKMYCCWIWGINGSNYTFRCKLLDTSATWSTSTTLYVSLAIPVE